MERQMNSISLKPRNNPRIIFVERRRKLGVNGEIIIDLRDGSTRVVNSRGLQIGGR
jgi:hypothetical protein